MFESNMLENMQSMQNNTTWCNPWRKLVSPQFKAFLDSLSVDNYLSTSSKEDIETTENEED